MEDHHHYSVIPHEMAGPLHGYGRIVSVHELYEGFGTEKRTHTHTLLCVQWSCDPDSGVFWICGCTEIQKS